MVTINYNEKEKDLVLKDICDRLPYWVKVSHKGVVYDAIGYAHGKIELCKPVSSITQWVDIDEIKPYLRPLSSMTEDEREDFWQNVLGIDWRSDLEIDEDLETVPFPFTETYCGFCFDNCYLSDTFAVIDWLNAHHFDYRGLIPKGLAISTEVFNPYKD